MSILYQGAREFGLELDKVQQDLFEAYYHLLLEWNQQVNLTAITEYTDVQVKHFLDSLSAAPLITRAAPQNKRLIDVGAGAGFPGAPLAIAFPELRVTLLEATGKKVRFLDTLARELPLENVTAVHARAEELAHNAHERETYDFAVARAVAELRTLVEYSLPFVRVGGAFIAYKALEAQAEAEAAAHAIEALGGRVREIILVKLPFKDDVRHLVVIDKVAPTPARYPRRSGMPEKKPL